MAMTATTSTSPVRHVSNADRLVNQFERELGLTTAELASALGVSTRSVNRWRAGETIPQREARAKLAELTELRDHMFRTFEDEAVSVWLRSPNHYLSNVTPAEMLRLGRFERVEAALEVIDSGIFL